MRSSDENRVAQEPVAGPAQIIDFGDKLRLDPMDARKHERRSKAGVARRRRAERHARSCQGLKLAA
jgi:hypothetical protein